MLDGIALTRFKSDIWRQSTHLFRAAIDPNAFPVSFSEIISLTTTDLVESRLISPAHQLTLGPFELAGIDKASSAPLKTILADNLLLVQCLEQHLIQVRQLLDSDFAFLPDWQIDDVMASIGTTGANCGAHFDHYDVFLVQFTGRKTWYLDDGGHDDGDLDESADIRVLRDFEHTRCLSVEPGDVLYVPPGVGHHGVCDGDAMTLSVGIRNPTAAELLADLTEFALDSLSDNSPILDQLYPRDGGLSPDAIATLEVNLKNLLDGDLLQAWYGSFATRLREPEIVDYTAVPSVPLTGCRLSVTLQSRVTYAAGVDGISLFANGERYALPSVAGPVVRAICEDRVVDIVTPITGEVTECLEALVTAGVLKQSSLP